MDWAILISAISLAVSAAVAVRTFVARPRLIASVWTMIYYHGEELGEEKLANVMHLANMGRSTLAIETVGRLTKEGSLTGTPAVFQWGEYRQENPKFPRSMAPGEFLTIYFADPDGESGDGTFAVNRITTSFKDWLLGRPRMTVKRIIVQRPKGESGSAISSRAGDL